MIASGNTEVPALWSEPAINPVESACIRDAMKDTFPTPALTPVSVPETQPSEAALISRLRTDIVPSVQPSRDLLRTSSPCCEVDFYLDSALVEQNRIDRIVSSVRKELASLVLGVECQREIVSTTLRGWRLVFRCRNVDEEELLALTKRLRSKHRDDTNEPDADETY